MTVLRRGKLLILMMLVIIFMLTNNKIIYAINLNGKILNNVYVQDINLSDLTKKEATPVILTTEEIYDIIEAYGDAAVRAMKAGIDAVELHCAHGYLVSTFISPRTNKRVDEFGGCFENRMRFPRLIIENIKKKTEGKIAILARINAQDDVLGGLTLQDSTAVAVYLEEVCKIDALHVSRATHLNDECMWAPTAIHGGFSSDLVSSIKEVINIPVITVGRFTEPLYKTKFKNQRRMGHF